MPFVISCLTLSFWLNFLFSKVFFKFFHFLNASNDRCQHKEYTFHVIDKNISIDMKLVQYLFCFFLFNMESQKAHYDYAQNHCELFGKPGFPSLWPWTRLTNRRPTQHSPRGSWRLRESGQYKDLIEQRPTSSSPRGNWRLRESGCIMISKRYVLGYLLRNCQ